MPSSPCAAACSAATTRTSVLSATKAPLSNRKSKLSVVPPWDIDVLHFLELSWYHQRVLGEMTNVMRLTVPDEDLAIRKEDIFGYRPFADRLTSVVGAVEGGKVIVLDGPWGSGKSTFLRQWRCSLEEQGQKSVLFDAFEHDFEEDPFLSIVIQLHEFLTSYDAGSAEEFRTVAANVWTLAMPTAKRIGLNIVASKLSDLGINGEAIKDAQEMVRLVQEQPELLHYLSSRPAVSEITNRIYESKKVATSISKFRGLIESGIAECLDCQDSKNETTSKPRKLILIIDELDRCKPPFSLMLLESIKHIFANSRICFIISANMEQIEHSVRQSYGTTNAEQYLEKFYHFRISLPSVADDYGRGRLGIYFDYLCKSMNILAVGDEDYREYRDIVLPVCEAHDANLRTLEQILMRLAWVKFGTPDLAPSIRPLIAVCITMHVLDVQLFIELRAMRAGFNEIVEFIRGERWPEQNHDLFRRVKKYWAYLLNPEISEEEMHEFSAVFGLTDHSIENRQGILRRCLNQMDVPE